MNNSSILKEAKNLLLKKGWTQHSSAKDACGEKVSIYSASARYFCLTGALNLAFSRQKNLSLDKVKSLWKKIEEQMPTIEDYGCIAKWNDDPKRQKFEVIDLLNTLISQEDSTNV